MHPRERIVEIDTLDGVEEVPVDVSKIVGEFLMIGYPVGQRGEDVLVELPQETARGHWRVWVKHTLLEA